MGAQKRITDAQRALVVRLVAGEGHSQRHAQKLCEQGVYGHEPFTVSAPTITEIVRQARLNTDAGVDDLELGDAFDKLARKALRIGNRELARIDATSGKLDADHFLKIARALRELQPLAKPQAAQHQDRQTFLGGIQRQQTAEPERIHQETEQSDSLSAPASEDPSDQASSLPLAA
jgi:hypothetical protein